MDETIAVTAVKKLLPFLKSIHIRKELFKKHPVGAREIDNYYVFQDLAMTVKKSLVRQEATTGGIDFKSDALNVEIKTGVGQGEMNVKIDPAMLKQLQSAAGLTPVIVKMEDLDDVPKFLGVMN